MTKVQPTSGEFHTAVNKKWNYNTKLSQFGDTFFSRVMFEVSQVKETSHMYTTEPLIGWSLHEVVIVGAIFMDNVFCM